MDKETPIKYVEGFCKETCEQIIGTRGSSTKNWLSVTGEEYSECAFKVYRSKNSFSIILETFIRWVLSQMDSVTFDATFNGSVQTVPMGTKYVVYWRKTPELKYIEDKKDKDYYLFYARLLISSRKKGSIKNFEKHIAFRPCSGV